MLKESRSIFFYMGVLFVPFFTFPLDGDGFETPKVLLLVILAGILGILAAFELSNAAKIPPLPNLLFLLSFICSTLFSFNPTYSIVGDYTRNTFSLLFILVLLIFQIIYLNFYAKFNLTLTLKIVSLILGFITVFETIPQPISTIGQSNFLSILIALGLLAFLTENQKQRGFYIFLSYLAVGFLAYVLVRTASITAVLSLFTILVFINIKKPSQSKPLLIAVILITLMLVFNNKLFYKFLDIPKQLNSSNNLVVSDSFLIRLSLWQSSYPIWIQNPKTFLVGVGPENFVLFFEKFRGVSNLNLTSEWDFHFDKPHNFYLQILIETGILGLLAFMYWLIKYFRGSDKEYFPFVAISLLYFITFWNFSYHFLTFFLMAIDRNQLISITVNKKVRSLLAILGLSIVFIGVLLLLNRTKVSGRNFQIYEENAARVTFDSDNKTNFFYQTSNTEIQIDMGLKYYQNRPLGEMKEYVNFLKNEYSKNLYVLINIYAVEKTYLKEEALLTKKKIEFLRPDLLDWHPLMIN